MTLRPLENRIVSILERWRRYIAIGFCIGIVVVAAVSLGAGKHESKYPADAVLITVHSFAGPTVIVAKSASKPIPLMGSVVFNYVGYHDNVRHHVAGMGNLLDIPEGPPLPGIAKD